MSRPERVSQMLKEEISAIIQTELKDPRIGFVTITQVEITPDLRYAKVFYSILGSTKEEKKTKEALESSLGFIKRELAARMNLRFMPEMIFKQDRSAEYSIQIQEALKEIKELNNEPGKGRKLRKKAQ